MHPYQHQQHQGSQNGPSTSQQLLGSVESAASRFKRAFGRKRLGRSGDQDGTESDWQGGRKNASSPRISSFVTRKEQPPIPQYPSATHKPQSQRLYEVPSSPHASAEVNQEGKQTSSFQADNRSDSPEIKPSAPVPTPISIPINTQTEHRTSQQFLPSPGVSAAIEYILDPPSRISVSSAASKPATNPESHTSHTTSSSKVSPRRSIGNERSSSPANAVKRRSMSLSMIPNFAALTASSTNPVAAPPSSFAKFTTSPYPPHQRSQSALPSHPGFVSPSLSETRLVKQDTPSVTPSDSEPQHPSHPKGKLALWTTSNSNLRSPRTSSPSHSKTSSVVATLDSAASAATGFAAHISRRAYEKVNSMLGPSNRPSSANNSSPRHGYETDANIQRLKTRPSANGPLGSQSDVETSRRRAASPAGDPLGGPRLGPMLRPPFRKVTQGGGLVFGRPLADCVRDTKPLVILGDSAGVGIEARFIPALVLRCVQHLERWGIDEEGLFRINGRSSHSNKLRIEFASGADYDLASCPPSDLDPHSVASVLKAYLRELPEPILTRNMAPLFDACFENAKQADFMNTASSTLPTPNGFSVSGNAGLPAGPRVGLPSGPREGTPFPRSVNDNIVNQATQSITDETAETTSNPAVTPQQAMTALLEEFRSFVLALPRENRDLLLTISELLAKTARHSRANKMPLSNLLLVFCPSMGMNPGVLKVLVENQKFIFSESNPGTSQKDYSLLPSPPSTAKTTSQFERTTMPADNYSEAKDTKQEEHSAGRPATQDSIIAQSPSEPVVNHPPVRKQSLRKNHIDNQRPQVTPVSSPSAYKESFNSSGSDSVKEISAPQPGTESSNRTNRTRPSPRSTSPLYQSGEIVRPAGPRPPKHTPPPLALRDQSSTPPSQSPRFIDRHNRKPSSSSLMGGSGPGSAVGSAVPFEMKEHHTDTSAEPTKGSTKSQSSTHHGSSVALAPSHHDAEVVSVKHEVSSSTPSASDGAVEIDVQELPEVPPVPPMTSSFVQPRVSTTPPPPTQVSQLPAIIYYPPSTIDDHSNGSIKVKTKQWARHAKNSSSTSTVLAEDGSQAPEQLNVVSPNGTQVPLPAEDATSHANSDGLTSANEVVISAANPQEPSNLLSGPNTSSQPLTPLLLAMEKENAQGYESRRQSNEDLTVPHTRPEVKPLSLTKKWSASSGTQDQTDSALYASSAASSATIDTPQLLERLTSWPEVPKTIPNVYPEPPRSESISITNVPSLLADPAGASTGPNTLQVDAKGQEEQIISQGNPATTSSNDRDTMSTIHPSFNGSQDRIGGPQLQQRTARRPSSMSSDSIKSDTNESTSNLNNTARPVRAHAPRLTVNSKEMISGDSFWAMELQRVLQSQSPTSQIESRLSGDWAAVHVTGDS